MKSRALKLSLFVLGALIIYSAVLLWLGVGIGTRIHRHQTAVAIDDTQIMLAFNRLLEERKVQALLSRGCASAALEQINIRIDQDTKLLASFFKSGLSSGISKYIDDRDPNLLKTLETFKSKYGDSWYEPQCPR